jgi:hypothetical protein
MPAHRLEWAEETHKVARFVWLPERRILDDAY